MDKTTYETYEFLPGNNVEAGADQFFVVQDDGTFLINRQTQYVTQVENVKEALEDVQACTVYDVSAQQYYVGVDSTSELIVSDQFILPENNLYGNSYLLQPGTSTNEEPIEVANIAQLDKQETQEANTGTTHPNSLNSSCTEITLTDEQYKMLEQKGWVLLEFGEKIFVLNNMGLHDITTNDKLIQKLRSEIQSDSTVIDSGALQVEALAVSQYPNTNTSNQQDAEVELVKPCDDNVGLSEKHLENEAPSNTVEPADCSNPRSIENSVVGSQSLANTNVDAQISDVLATEPIEVTTCVNEQNTVTAVKIKTELMFRDIPDKIFLGTTVNGKRLVAKVESRNNKRNIKRRKLDPNSVKIVFDKIDKNKCINMALDEAQFLNLVQIAMRGHPSVNCSGEDVSAAERVIAQVLRVHNLKRSLLGHNMVVTKVIDNLDEAGKILSRSEPTFVSGIITPLEEADGRFIHIPDLLQRLKSESDQINNVDNTNEYKDSIQSKAVSVIHINVWESKRVSNSTRVSITLNKRKLYLDLIFDLKKLHPTTVFVCDACAAIFKSEDLLKEHQENQCIESDDTLTMDTNKIDSANKLYSMIKYGKKIVYACLQCKAKFSRHNNCKKHVKTHLVSDNTISENIDTQPKSNMKEIYKCKMCPSTYFHPSSLSKHIVSRHIKGK